MLQAHELLYQVEAEYRRSQASQVAARHRIDRELDALRRADSEAAKRSTPAVAVARPERGRSATSLRAQVVQAARRLVRRAAVSAR